MITIKAEYYMIITNVFIFGVGFIKMAYGTNGRTIKFSGAIQSNRAP